jgi:hypothetical protein
MASTSPRETPEAVPAAPDGVDDAAARRRVERFGSLPPRITPGQMVETRPADPPNDPSFGRNPDNDWLIRYCA